MKKLLVLGVILILFVPNITFASACKYSGKIAECSAALENFIGSDKKYITPGASIKTVEDFPCLQDSYEKRVFQIAMDENFKKIDKELEEDLGKIYTSKDFYFGKDAQYNYKDGVDYIYDKEAYFKKKYGKDCQKSLEEAVKCLENKSYPKIEDRPSISIKEGSNFLKDSKGSCYELVTLKGAIYKNVAYNGLLLNREQVSKDQKKKYQQGQRKKYSNVLDLLMHNLSYIERIWKKWTSKTKNPLK